MLLPFTRSFQDPSKYLYIRLYTKTIETMEHQQCGCQPAVIRVAMSYVATRSFSFVGTSCVAKISSELLSSTA